MHAWTSFPNLTNPIANRVDFPSEAEGAQQQVAPSTSGVQSDYLLYVAQGEELQRVSKALKDTRHQQQRTELHLEERKTKLARCHQKLAYLRFQLDIKSEPVQFTELTPPQAVPAMAAAVGPPTSYAPPNAPNPLGNEDGNPKLKGGDKPEKPNPAGASAADGNPKPNKGKGKGEEKKPCDPSNPLQRKMESLPKMQKRDQRITRRPQSSTPASFSIQTKAVSTEANAAIFIPV
eukprot:48334-Amphidinium_carterae.2